MTETLVAPTRVNCPYCGEGNSLLLEVISEPQTLYQDCAACCQPMLISLSALDEQADYQIQVSTDRE